MTTASGKAPSVPRLRCPEHDTDLVWRDGSPLPGYDPAFRPVGWDCPCDPGHPLPSRSVLRRTALTAPTDEETTDG